MANENTPTALASPEATATRGSRPSTDTNIVIQIIIGFLGTALIYFAVAPLQRSEVAEIKYIWGIISDRGPIQYMELIMAFMVAALVFMKLRIIRSQIGVIAESPIPTDIDLTDDERIQELRQQFAARKEFSWSIVLNRVDRMLSLWLGSKDISRVAGWHSSESDRDSMGADSSYSIARVLIWAIPIMGFIGTVLGLGKAVSGFSEFLSGASELSAIKDAIGNVTVNLGVAFDTTLLALILSVFLMFPLSSVQRKEENLFLEIDNYLDDMLISRFPSPEQQPIVIENLEDAIEAAFRRYIPDPDRYDEVFSRSIERAAATVEDRFGSLANNYQSTLRDLTGRLATSLASAGDALNESLTQSTDKSISASQDLAKRMESVAAMAANIEDLLKIEEAIERSLAAISSSDDFQRTMQDLREHLATTDEFCHRLSRPRVITLQEDYE